MSTTATTELDLHPSIQLDPDLAQAARAAAEYLEELASRTFPRFDGRLRLQMKADAPRKGDTDGNLWMALILIDEVGGFGSIAGLRTDELTDLTSREDRLRELWMSALWERSNVLEKRVGRFVTNDEEGDRGSSDSD